MRKGRWRNDERRSLSWVPSRGLALKIALGYGLAGALWIFFSGWILHALVPDAAAAAFLENLKAGSSWASRPSCWALP